MSFSTEVKEELNKLVPGEEHCRIAELSALFSFYVKVVKKPEYKLVLSVDNSYALRKCFTLLGKTFNIKADVFQKGLNNEAGFAEFTGKDFDIEAVLKKLSLEDPMAILKKDCCKRAYLRGAFLATGFVNDPVKSYHLEIITEKEEYSKLLTYLLSQFNIIAKHSLRKKYHVTYLKEVEAVSDVLSVLGATRSMMGLANTRIEKHVRNNTNRRYNCDLANVQRSVNAASKQIEDILFIKEKVGLDELPDSLREMAYIRAEFPEESFSDLGSRLNPPVGKSGVNHRLRKISEFADELRNAKEKA